MKKAAKSKKSTASQPKTEGQSSPVRVVILGAAGRDFHNFNTFYRGNKNYKVVAFTATQIPGIEGRTYPRVLAGPQYPKGIPIYPEDQLLGIVKKEKADEAVFAYSDVSHEYVMHKASTALAAGLDFRLMGGKTTMLKSKKPVVSICAVRTGSGKSQTSRAVSRHLLDKGYRVVSVRHPMPYGNLAEQACQRFATLEDLDKYKCTIEEREEYEAYVVAGMVIYAGVDYGQILSQAEKEADIVIWDGGNNDLPFYKPNLHIVVADPYRPGHEMKYYPGEANVRMADIVLINKVNTADPKDVETVKKNVQELNPNATILMANSVIKVDNEALVKGKKVLVIEDGPTVTHGGMTTGAGTVAAQMLGASEIVDPRPYAFGSIAGAYKKYPHMTRILPALGYGDAQVKELEKTINAIPCDLVVIGTPIDLRNVLTLNKPAVRARYELQEQGSPNLMEILDKHYPGK